MVRQKFRKERSRIIASFSFTDLAAGTGVVTYYGLANKSTTTITYDLNQNVVYSGIVEIEGVVSQNATVKLFDLDFDLTQFNLPQTIDGTATVEICSFVSTGGGEATTIYVIPKIRKWDGSTETEIAEGRGQNLVVGASTTGTIIDIINITIPRTNFKKGETLRLTIEGWYIHTGGGGSIYAIGHDPRNRDGTRIKPSSDDPTTTTVMKLNMPFIPRL